MDLKSLWEAAKIIEAESPVFQTRAPLPKLSKTSTSPAKESPESYNRNSYCLNGNKKSTVNRLNHNNLEKCRRAYLRNCLGNLRSFIPKSGDCSKSTTLSLLVTSKDYISSLDLSENKLRDSLLKAFDENFKLRKNLSNHIDFTSTSRISEQMLTIQSCVLDFPRERILIQNTEDEFSSTDSTISFKSDDSLENGSCDHPDRSNCGGFSNESTMNYVSDKNDPSAIPSSHCHNLMAGDIVVNGFSAQEPDGKHMTEEYEDRRDTSSEYSCHDTPRVDFDHDHLYGFEPMDGENQSCNVKICEDDDDHQIMSKFENDKCLRLMDDVLNPTPLKYCYREPFDISLSPPSFHNESDSEMMESDHHEYPMTNGNDDISDPTTCDSESGISPFMDCIENFSGKSQEVHHQLTLSSSSSRIIGTTTIRERRSLRKSSNISMAEPIIPGMYSTKSVLNSNVGTVSRRHRSNWLSASPSHS